MRVGIDVRSLQFSGGLRGTGRYVHNLLTGLSELGSDAEFSLLYFEKLPFPERLQCFSALPRLPVSGQPELETRYPWYQSHIRLRQLPILPSVHERRFYQVQAGNFVNAVKGARLDLVHFPSPFEVGIGPVMNCPVRTVYTFLDGIPLVFPKDFFDRWPVAIQRLYRAQQLALRTATRVVGISDCSKEDAIRLYGVPRDRAVRVYASLEPELSNPIPSELIESARAKFRLKNRYFAFCSVADRHKGIDSLVAAMATLRESSGYPFQLVVIGNQPPKVRTLIRDLCFDQGLNGRDVVVTGYIAEEDLNALLKGSIAVVTPSRYEGFGYPAAQAMALGVPVIASNRASLPEVVGDAALSIDPDDPDTIVNALRRLADDEGSRAELIKRGLERARLFDCKSLAAEMLEVYRTASS